MDEGGGEKGKRKQSIISAKYGCRQENCNTTGFHLEICSLTGHSARLEDIWSGLYTESSAIATCNADMWYKHALSCEVNICWGGRHEGILQVDSVVQ